MKNNIAIIGGGREGMWWKRLLERNGQTVVVSNKQEDNLSAIQKSDVILIAVPISAIKSLRKVLKAVSEEKLIISTCGLMLPMKKVLAGKKVSTLFLHRMIGPQVQTMKGHSLVVSGPFHSQPIEKLKWDSFVGEIINITEANVVHATPTEHDEMVGLTQALVRIIVLGIGLVAMQAPLPVAHFKNVPFAGLMMVLARVIDFGHLLSQDMVFENKFSRKWIDKLHNAMIQVETGKENFEELFERLQKFLGNESVKTGSNLLGAMPSWWT